MQSESVERNKPILNPTVVHCYFAETTEETRKRDEWLKKNCHNQWFHHLSAYVFEDVEEAMAFKLAFDGRMIEKHLYDDDPCP